MVAIGTCQAGVTQGKTYMDLVTGTTLTKEWYSKLIQPNKLIYQSVANFTSITFSLRKQIAHAFEIRIRLCITTILVQIASALIKLQMLTCQSDRLVSMKKMGRCNWFQPCTSVGHCTVPSSTSLVWPLGICLEWVVDMFTEKHSSTLTLLILSSRQAT